MVIAALSSATLGEGSQSQAFIGELFEPALDQVQSGSSLARLRRKVEHTVLKFGTVAAASAYDPTMTSTIQQAYRASESMRLIGGLLRRSRRELISAMSRLAEATTRERVDIDSIIARLDVGAIVARLDMEAIVARLDMDEVVARLAVDEIVSRLDVDEIVRSLAIEEIVARLDMDEIVARLDVDSIVARLDIDEVVARIDFARLAGQVVDGVNLPGVVRKSANSLVRNYGRPAKA